MKKHLIQGTVTDYWQNKGYGFVHIDGRKDDIFFHIGDGRLVGIKNSKPEIFTDHLPEEIIKYGYPRKNDVISFTLRNGKDNQPKCAPWCFTRMIEYIERDISMRQQNKMPTKFVAPLESDFDYCFYCYEIVSVFGRDCGHCRCEEEAFEKLMEDPMDFEPEEELVVTTLPDGRQGVLLNDYHETNLGDSAGGLRVYE